MAASIVSGFQYQLSPAPSAARAGETAARSRPIVRRRPGGFGSWGPGLPSFTVAGDGSDAAVVRGIFGPWGCGAPSFTVDGDGSDAGAGPVEAGAGGAAATKEVAAIANAAARAASTWTGRAWKVRCLVMVSLGVEEWVGVR